MNAVVDHVMEVAQGVRSFVLRPADGSSGFAAAAPGAHVDLSLADGLVRSYSLYQPATRGEPYKIAVALESQGRGGSKHMFDRVTPGTVLEVSAPKNHFALVEDATATVLVAGGIGITPLYAMATRLASLGRPWTLHYAARTRAGAAFVCELETLAASSGGQVFFSFADDADRRRLDLQRVFDDAPAGTHFYCCGPKRMIDGFVVAGGQRPAACVHVEHFEGVTPTGQQKSFSVRLARSDKVLDIPAGKTILDMVEQAGIAVAHACKEGVCAACEVRVLEGIPDHRDLVLSKKERAQNQSMMICCSGSVSAELVLDL